MKIVDMHEAETDLPRLVEEALAGRPFAIAKDGRPLVRVTALAPEEAAQSRFGFMQGQISIPDDFDRMAADEIAADFDATEKPSRTNRSAT